MVEILVALAIGLPWAGALVIAATRDRHPRIQQALAVGFALGGAAAALMLLLHRTDQNVVYVWLGSAFGALTFLPDGLALFLTIVATAIGSLAAVFSIDYMRGELYESYRVIRAILDHLPGGELTVNVKLRIPPGDAISRVEAPRGELFYYLRSEGGVNPDRMKVRTPSLCNWASVLVLAPGHKLADIPMLLAGIDPCFSCSDRTVTVRRRAGADTWSWAQLRQHGIEYYR